MVRVALLKLQCLKNRLVVLVLVLKHHVVDVAALEEGVAIIPLERVEAIEDSRTYFPKPLHHLDQCRKGKRSTSGAWMLERVVHPGHLRELDRSIQILGEPQLFEMRYVTYVPDDGTHERIVLSVQVFVRQSRDQQ